MYIIKLTFQQLIQSGVHVGYSKIFLNRKLKSYIFGYYNHFYIINLYYTAFQLKLLIQIIIDLAISNQSIWFIQSKGFFWLNEKKKKIKRHKLFFYNYAWMYGFLTNFKYLRQHWFEININLQKMKMYKSTVYSILKKSKPINYYSIKFFPSLIIFFDNYNSEALKEAYILGIPTAGVIDTQFKHFDYLNYPIIGNNKSYNSLLLYYGLFYNAILKGIQLECIKALAVS